MTLRDDYRIIYTDYCINKFAEAYGLTVRKAFDYLYEFKGLDFLDECYEAEHQLSLEEAVADLATICQQNGGAL